MTFIERQIAHVWMASTLGSISLFGVEILLKLPVLSLSPVLAVLGGMVFLVKAGMLSGSFYFSAAACLSSPAIGVGSAGKRFGGELRAGSISGFVCGRLRGSGWVDMIRGD